MLLENKVAIVTGAGSGIDAIIDAGRLAVSVEVDVADAASVAAMVDAATTRFGGVDGLINNAGTVRLRG